MKSFIVFVLLTMLTACSFKSNRGEHKLNVICSTTELLKIKSIECSDDATKIKFAIDSTVNCGAWPPRHENAMFIKDANSEKTYKLINIEGISIRPKGGGAKEFTLTFEALPKELFKVHLIEGNLTHIGAWNFMNVNIPSN